MELHEVLGWVAAAFTLSAFMMRSMMPLRWCAIGSNCAFIGYGLLSSAWPVLILHVLLLPFNIVRLVEMRRLVDQVRVAVHGSLSPDWLRPYSRTLRLAAGERLFARGDAADRTYVLLEGRLALPDIGESVGPGELVGEIAAFAPDGRRTQTVVAQDGCELLVIDNPSLRELYFQNPQFGFYLIGLISRRLSADSRRSAAPAPRPAAGG